MVASDGLDDRGNTHEALPFVLVVGDELDTAKGGDVSVVLGGVGGGRHQDGHFAAGLDVGQLEGDVGVGAIEIAVDCCEMPPRVYCAFHPQVLEITGAQDVAELVIKSLQLHP